MMLRRAGLIALLLVAGASRDAQAFLDTGTLLTNAASATYTGGSQGTNSATTVAAAPNTTPIRISWTSEPLRTVIEPKASACPSAVVTE